MEVCSNRLQNWKNLTIPKFPLLEFSITIQLQLYSEYSLCIPLSYQSTNLLHAFSLDTSVCTSLHQQGTQAVCVCGVVYTQAYTDMTTVCLHAEARWGYRVPHSIILCLSLLMTQVLSLNLTLGLWQTSWSIPPASAPAPSTGVTVMCAKTQRSLKVLGPKLQSSCWSRKPLDPPSLLSKFPKAGR